LATGGGNRYHLLLGDTNVRQDCFNEIIEINGIEEVTPILDAHEIDRAWIPLSYVKAIETAYLKGKDGDHIGFQGYKVKSDHHPLLVRLNV